MSNVMTNVIRVLIVDDRALVRSGLGMLIRSRPDMTVVGEAAHGAGAIASAARERPDIILLDLEQGADNALDLLPDLQAASRNSRIIALTATQNVEALYRAVRQGAMGAVTTEQAAEVLLMAIYRVHEGEAWLDPRLAARVLFALNRECYVSEDQGTLPHFIALTRREREIIQHISQGLQNSQIGARLFISESTVRHHLTSIFGKLGVANRLELVAYAYQHGLARPRG